VLVLDGSGRARMHPGDVSGLLAQMARERAEPKAPPQRTQAAVAVSTAARAKRRIAPWQQRELDDLEAQIPAREAQLAELDARLSEPALYSGPRAALEEVQCARQRLEQEIAALYTRWEALEALRG